ncbi:all-trans retinoic acid-induced differentiation factor isoform X2 [Pogona vitticeps]
MASPGGHRVPRLLLGFLVAAAAAEPGAAPPPGQVCGEGCCAGPAPEGSAVAAFCGNRTGAELRGRCCVDGAPEQEAVVVVGLDLGNCSLTTLCSGFQEARTAVIIDLTGNPLRDLPEDAFRGFTQLQTLALPRHLDCPGGSKGWENMRVQGSSRSCQGQRNPCNGSAGLESQNGSPGGDPQLRWPSSPGVTEWQAAVPPWGCPGAGGGKGCWLTNTNHPGRLLPLCSSCRARLPAPTSQNWVWLCPEASLCTPDGPGLFQCLCMSPYHGYKCLRQGSFPYLLFLGTLGAATAILSILLWVTQRRKAKTS